MAVEWVKLSSAGASGKASGKDPRKVKASYRANFRVKCDDPADTPNVVLSYFRGNALLPWAGRVFKFGDGFDVSAICANLDADYIENSGGYYNVVSTYDPVEGDKEEEEEEGEEDPLKWKDEIDVSWTQITVPVESAIFQGFISGKEGAITNPFMKVGATLPVTNSAKVPFDPGMEEEVEIKVVRITKNSATYNDAAFSGLQGTVNNAAVTVSKPSYGFNCVVPALKGKLRLGASYATANNTGYWRQTAEIYINPLGWRRALVDRGLTRRAEEGDPDGHGGVISASDLPRDGTPLLRPILDIDGFPITEPVLLNGNGQPKTATAPPVYLLWQTKQEVSWANIRW